jgi:hypothetical protein
MKQFTQFWLIIAFFAMQAIGGVGLWPQSEFVILGGDYSNKTDQPFLQTYKNANFNVNPGWIPTSDWNTFFTNCANINLKGFWNFWVPARSTWNSTSDCGLMGIDNIECAAQNQVNNLIGSQLTPSAQSQVYGFWFADEPFRSGATITKPDAERTIDDVLRFAAAIRKYDPKAVNWVTLLPYNNNIAPPDNGFADTIQYKNYISSAFTNVNTNIISFDYYPFIDSAGKTVPFSYVFDNNHKPLYYFYKHLSWYANLAVTNGKSFWWWVCSQPYKNSTVTPVFRTNFEITLNRMRFDVNAGLIYGAKGICYWAYDVPVGLPLFQASFLTLPTDNPPYQPTPDIYIWGQTINKVTANLGKELVRLKWNGTYHQKASDPTMAESRLPVLPSTTTSLDSIVSTSAANFAVGTFKKGYLEYFLALNKDIVNSQNVTLKFKSNKPIYSYNATTAQWIQVSPSNNQIVINGVEPGGVKLVRFGPPNISPAVNLLKD